MRAKRVEQRVLTKFVLTAGVTLFVSAYGAIAYAQSIGAPPASPNPSSSLTVPQQPENAVSPTTPGTLPGTAAGPNTAVGANPVTGAPCVGGGSTAITGGVTGAPTTPNQPPQPGQTTTGLPPNNSVYGLGTQLNTSNPGAC